MREQVSDILPSIRKYTHKGFRPATLVPCSPSPALSAGGPAWGRGGVNPLWAYFHIGCRTSDI